MARSRLEEKYTKEVAPKLKEKLGVKNDLAVPRIDYVTVNVGAGKALKDSDLLDKMIDNIAAITGQRPVKTLATKSISAFKIREGLVVGLMVTLRGTRMYNFLDKLVNVTLPRTRDFRGLSPLSFDGRGNFSLGFKEQVAFPEIAPDAVEKLHGLQVSVITTAENDKDGRRLLKMIGFPFKTIAEAKQELAEKKRRQEERKKMAKIKEAKIKAAKEMAAAAAEAEEAPAEDKE